jgi:hypothetical protein
MLAFLALVTLVIVLVIRSVVTLSRWLWLAALVALVAVWTATVANLLPPFWQWW